ncbi:Mas-related G-protein coupled receptor member E, partial [Plecturocebus cupreus]
LRAGSADEVTAWPRSTQRPRGFLCLPGLPGSLQGGLGFLLLPTPGQELSGREGVLPDPLHHRTPRDSEGLVNTEPEPPGRSEDRSPGRWPGQIQAQGQSRQDSAAPLPPTGHQERERAEHMPAAPPAPHPTMDPREAGQHGGPTDGAQEDVAFNLVILSLTEGLGLGGLLGNGAVLWLLSSNVYRNPFAIYLLDVACADLIFLGCHMVAVVPDLLPGRLAFPGFVQTSLATLRFLCYIVGLSLLGAVSVEQCLAALFPAWYACRRPRHLTTCVCALTWALCLLLHLLLSGACTQFFGEPSRPLCRALWLAAAALLAVLCCTVCGASLLLLLRLERGPQRPPPRGFPALVLLTVLLFLFCGLPFGIYWLSRNLLWHIPHYFYHFSFLMAAVHCTAKPVVYFWLGSAQGRRWPLRLVLQRALGDETELGAVRETSRRGLVDIAA